MKKLLLIIATVCIISGCAVKVKKQSTACKVPREDLFNKIMMVASDYNLSPKLRDDKIGLMILESEPSYSGMYLTTKSWKIQYKGDTLIAYAKMLLVQKNAFGNVIATNETYYDDTSHKDHQWYWNIRDMIEQVCGSKTIFSTTESF